MSKTNTYYTQSPNAVAAQFGVEPAHGLSQHEVKARQEKFGLNQLPSGPKLSALKLFLSQFKDILIIVLIIAATVSLGVSFIEKEGSFTESLLIYAIVVAIAVVGFLNEYKAEKTVEALKKLVSQTCRVRRNGEEIEIPADQLVPGDIVLLDEGKKVPADIRLLSANYLQVNEASLTGESLPVNKQIDPISGELALGDQKNMLFSGTLITTGTTEGVVVATGAATEIGKIAALVSSVESEETPMQRKLDDLGKKLGVVILLICIAMFGIILLLDRELADVDFLQRLLLAFTAAVALAVAAIPEGLAFVVRISLALGARRMAAKNALVRKLSAVESLGSTDVVCSDKTGTLTKGEMTVRKLYCDGTLYELTGSGYETKGELQKDGSRIAPTRTVLRLAEIGLLCNNARLHDEQILGDPTEGSLLVTAVKVGIKNGTVSPRIAEIPFNSNRKMMSTLHQAKSGFLVATKGAPDVMLDKCTHVLVDGKVVAFSADHKKAIQAVISQMASEALRVLGFAYKETASRPSEAGMEKGLVFVGLQAMMDPPRVEVKEVITRVQSEAGMRVVMITGDNIETAKAVARELGIEGEALSGMELENLSDDEFKRKVETVSVYARVDPEHKIRIVRTLQHNGHQVAMTGDGVNDAPAIKAADIGVAMGITGTDAAKEASDMILLDDQFLTIIKAVEEGRGIFDNVRKFVNFLLSCNIAEVITVLLGILFHGNLVLTAAQLLFINIVTDGLPAVALGSDPVSKDVMKFKPSHYQQAIITPRVWAEIVVFGVLMSAALLAQYTFNLGAHGAAVASSAIFLGMVVYEFVRLADIRSDYRMSWFSNPLLVVSMAVSLLLQVALIYFPPLANIFKVMPVSALDWLMIAGGSVALFAIMKLLNPLFDFIGPENPLPKSKSILTKKQVYVK
ncbi:MAG: cation-translocating P-type ATPase [Candidatus Saccharimonadales bacterium]